jgi:hypothetical protein
MTKEITISFEEDIIERALERARAEDVTLEDLIRGWLADYTQRRRQVDEAMATIEALSANIDMCGRKFTREEMNER